MRIAPNMLPAKLPKSGGWISPTGQFIAAELLGVETLVPHLPADLLASIRQNLAEFQEEDSRLESDPLYANLEPHDESLDGAKEVNALNSQAGILQSLFDAGFIRLEPNKKQPTQVIGTVTTSVASVLMQLPFPAVAANRTPRNLVGLEDSAPTIS